MRSRKLCHCLSVHPVFGKSYLVLSQQPKPSISSSILRWKALSTVHSKRLNRSKIEVENFSWAGSKVFLLTYRQTDNDTVFYFACLKCGGMDLKIQDCWKQMLTWRTGDSVVDSSRVHLSPSNAVGVYSLFCSSINDVCDLMEEQKSE